ncbi:MAG: metallophosphoesterase [Pseudomonadota bacterium]
MSDQAAPGPFEVGRRVWRRLLPLVVVCLFYFGVLVYPILRIWSLLAGSVPGTPTLLVIMVGPLLARLAHEFYPGTLTRWLSAVAFTWLGICFMAFLLVLAFEIARLLIPLADFTWGAILAGLLGAFTVYAFVNAQRLLVREISIPAPAPLAGRRLAQISDVHVGSRSGAFLNRVVRRVNALEPDYVLITGDLIDFRDISREELASLGTLTAPSYFIIGNHERYVDVEAICERLSSLGVNVLRNQTVSVDGMQLIGIDDAEPKTQVGQVLKSLTPDPDAFRILLYHRPDGAEDAARWGAELMLCGHTHNGQIVPFNFIVRRVFPHIQGLYEIGALKLYVSPGTGTWGPVLRLGSRSEVTVITLSASSDGQDTP